MLAMTGVKPAAPVTFLTPRSVMEDRLLSSPPHKHTTHHSTSTVTANPGIVVGHTPPSPAVPSILYEQKGSTSLPRYEFLFMVWLFYVHDSCGVACCFPPPQHHVGVGETAALQ
ncbi:hypothetical protein BaRGS_00006015 [Batillaria attramentaria]|uniref:Uncharacterized protein n=1 Tax=Batillaria attramentaria TaxID=370345 RepID=A0ABD0LT94_9CAEN